MIFLYSPKYCGTASGKVGSQPPSDAAQHLLILASARRHERPTAAVHQVGDVNVFVSPKPTLAQTWP